VLSKTIAQRFYHAQKSDYIKSSDDKHPSEHSNPNLSLLSTTEPAPVDNAAFGKKLGEIITNAVCARRSRQKPGT
jgi:hypothetical protein